MRLRFLLIFLIINMSLKNALSFRMETNIGTPAPSGQGRKFSFPAAIFISPRQRRPCASFYWGGAASPYSPPLDPPLLKSFRPILI